VKVSPRRRSRSWRDVPGGPVPLASFLAAGVLWAAFGTAQARPLPERGLSLRLTGVGTAQARPTQVAGGAGLAVLDFGVVDLTGARGPATGSVFAHARGTFFVGSLRLTVRVPSRNLARVMIEREELGNLGPDRVRIMRGSRGRWSHPGAGQVIRLGMPLTIAGGLTDGETVEHEIGVWLEGGDAPGRRNTCSGRTFTHEAAERG
jgi:hypothetical protein